jgi:hypothetical protein
MLQLPVGTVNEVKLPCSLIDDMLEMIVRSAARDPPKHLSPSPGGIPEFKSPPKHPSEPRRKGEHSTSITLSRSIYVPNMRQFQEVVGLK